MMELFILVSGTVSIVAVVPLGYLACANSLSLSWRSGWQTGAP